MQIAEVNKVAEAATSRLIEALKAGKSEALVEYFRTLSRFHSYSYRNMMLIFAQKKDATRVAGFHAWKNLKRRVKKGEKGIVIVAPIFKKSNEGLSDSDRDKVCFKGCYVFDISQTEGEELAKFSETTGDPGAFCLYLKDFLSVKGIQLSYSQDLNGADGMSRGGKIVLRNNLTPSTEFSVLVHELAHEILHQKAADKKSQRVRELEAEAVAFVVSEAIGLQSLEASKDYIQLYEGNDELLSESLAAIHRASSEILTFILKAEDHREAA